MEKHPIQRSPVEVKRGKGFVPALLGSTSLAAMAIMGINASAVAQDTSAAEADAFEEIVVTGIRSSLRQSTDIKRSGKGVVDGIVAEDIGKFPDSNLAESLQRISGVAINRQGGEGSLVTVRGFGPGFNHVTLNGRSMPGADIPIVGGDGSGVNGSGRSFDFSNLAAEGVRALEVYKTGRADIASGGIGATINVETRKPLDQEGLVASIGAKAAHDSGVDLNNDITPEFTGFLSWSDEDKKFGISLFGGYSRRDYGAASAVSASWNIETAGTFLDPSNGRVTDSTVITNAPTDLTQLVSVPRDSRYQFDDTTRERINGQMVMQFNPTDTVRLTADILYAENEATEQRAQVSNWFNRPFSEVVFDDNDVVATTVFLAEELSSPKDYALQQSYSSTKDKLESYGFNAEWDATDELTITLDAHTSEASVTPNAPMGYSTINVGMAMPVVTSHSVDYSGEIPVIGFTFDDSIASNGDGVYDVSDVSTQIANDLRVISQYNDIDQIDLRGDWELDEVTTVTVGANLRKQKNVTDHTTYRQVMGNWGASNPGDVESLAPGALEMFDMTAAFSDLDIGSGVIGVRGNAADIFAATSPYYESLGNAPFVLSDAYDEIEEEVLSVYAQVDTEFELADKPVRVSVGLRYEQTDVSSYTATVPTESIIWEGDNDFARVASTSADGLTLEASYDNFLPNLDFAIDMTDEFVTRFSYSKTLARAGYGQLFASDSINTPAGPTALGNVATGTRGNPGLLPLVSDNFDISFEWYYGEDDWVSVGAFHKKVKNFVGIGQFETSMFGLLDMTSGEDGSRSGTAIDLLNSIGADISDRNLFAMTALIDQQGSGDAALAVFQANQTDSGALDDAFYIQLESDLDVVADGNDPLMEFSVTQPINSEEASIRGLEFAFQHFFGDSGFGIGGSYTLVDGDIEFDNGADPSEDQFALVGLSDTANLTLIYERHGFSARASYNWRDEYLASTNRGGGFRNPTYVEEFATIDFNVSYDVNENVTVSFEAINITGENSRTYGRSTNNLWFARENSPRYFLGARYKF